MKFTIPLGLGFWKRSEAWPLCGIYFVMIRGSYVSDLVREREGDWLRGRLNQRSGVRRQKSEVSLRPGGAYPLSELQALLSDPQARVYEPEAEPEAGLEALRAGSGPGGRSEVRDHQARGATWRKSELNQKSPEKEITAE